MGSKDRSSGSTVPFAMIEAHPAFAVQKIEDLQRNYQKQSEDAWKTWRIVAVAIFFGLLILLGVVAGALALIDRTPRTTAAFTLLLWIWAGLVLLLGAGKPPSCQSDSHTPRSNVLHAAAMNPQSIEMLSNILLSTDQTVHLQSNAGFRHMQFGSWFC